MGNSVTEEPALSEEKFLFEFPLQDILFCYLKLQLRSFPSISQDTFTHCAVTTNCNFLQNTNIMNINCKCKLHIPLHTLRQTAWTKYNAIQVWMKSEFAIVKKDLKRKKEEKKKEKLETTVSLPVTSHILSV